MLFLVSISHPRYCSRCCGKPTKMENQLLQYWKSPIRMFYPTHELKNARLEAFYTIFQFYKFSRWDFRWFLAWEINWDLTWKSTWDLIYEICKIEKLYKMHLMCIFEFIWEVKHPNRWFPILKKLIFHFRRFLAASRVKSQMRNWHKK